MLAASDEQHSAIWKRKKTRIFDNKARPVKPSEQEKNNLEVVPDTN